MPHSVKSRVASSWRAYLALVIGVLCIAWSALFVVWAAVPGPASAFYRMAIAALVLVPLRLARGGYVVSRRGALVATAGGVAFALDLAFFNSAILRSSASTATLLGNTAPVFVGIGSWLFFGRRQTARFWSGLALAMAGSATLVGADALHADPLARAAAIGHAMALASASFYATYLLITEHGREGMDTLTFSVIAAVASVLTLLVVCAALGVPLAGSAYSARTWWALAGLGLISQLGGYLAIAYALGHLPATVTSVGLLAQVPLTALLAVPLLGDRLSAAQLTGGALVLGGIVVVNSGRISRAAG